MKRNFVAIILVFALLLSFAACRKIETEDIIIESKAYIVDDEGVTRDIYNVGSDYYYYDGEGNRIEANSKDVVIETNTVKVTEPPTLTPEQQSFIDSFGEDVGSIEDMMEADATVPNLENGELIPDDAFNNDLKLEVDEEGNPIHEDVELSYEEIIAGNTFSMEANVKTNAGGVETIAPLNIMRNGTNLYFETALPLKEGTGSTRVNLLFLDDACYIIIPSMRAYMSMPKETAGEMIPSDAFDNLEEVEGTYISSSEVVHNGETYICDVYETEGATTKYYYQNGQLKRVETVSGEDSSILEFKTLSTQVDESKFAVPKNYIDLSTIMSEDYMSIMTS
jgi:hypothetical protein